MHLICHRVSLHFSFPLVVYCWNDKLAVHSFHNLDCSYISLHEDDILGLLSFSI